MHYFKFSINLEERVSKKKEKMSDALFQVLYQFFFLNSNGDKNSFCVADKSDHDRSSRLSFSRYFFPTHLRLSYTSPQMTSHSQRLRYSSFSLQNFSSFVYTVHCIAILYKMCSPVFDICKQIYIFLKQNFENDDYLNSTKRIIKK